MGHEQPLMEAYLHSIEKLAKIREYANSMQNTQQHMYGTDSRIAQELLNIVGEK